METQRNKLLKTVHELKDELQTASNHKQTDRLRLEDLRRKRQTLLDTVTTTRVQELSALVEHVLDFTEHLETSIGSVWTVVDGLVAKTTALIEDVVKLVTDTHDSLLRRTIAINIEYELKRELLATSQQSPDGWWLTERDILGMPTWNALEIATRNDKVAAEAVLARWFPDSNYTQKNFSMTMQMLKSASRDVHPAKDLDGNTIEVATAEALLRVNFDVTSGLTTQKWDNSNKTVALYYLQKLVDLRRVHGDTVLLHS